MIIGLTGGIGSGKSAAANFFKELGINILDADNAAKDALDKNAIGYKMFIKEFGNQYLDGQKNIDRKKLREDVFKDPNKKLILEKIVHPIVGKTILNFISNSNSPYTIIMVPLIFETKSENNYDRILTIDCNEEIQISRAMQRDNQDKKQIQNILSKQASREQRLSISDDIILNNSTLNNLKQEVQKVHEKYLRLVNNE
jgi:dephospho-CoA kinase